MTSQVLWWSAGLHQIPAGDDWVDEAEADRFRRMQYTKRRDEARLARHTAKSTVARALGRPTHPAALLAITVRNARDGAPELMVDGAPANVAIAMTDRADWAVTAVLPGTARIGCDLELVEARSPAFVRDYFTRGEQEAVASTTDHQLAANLVWSAKESALKVLRTGLRRDTRTVTVQWTRGPGTAWAPLAVTAIDTAVMPGWWIRYGDFVLTVVGAVPTSEPVSLEEPPPLASAVPGHAWMDAPRVT